MKTRNKNYPQFDVVVVVDRKKWFGKDVTEIRLEISLRDRELLRHLITGDHTKFKLVPVK